MGTYTKYYLNGNLLETVPLVDGKMHGLMKRYTYHGEFMSEVPYVNGKRHGIAKSFFTNGKIKNETPFENGLIHGIKKGYYTNGNLRYEKPYKHQVRHGLWRYFREDGTEKGCICYQNGRIIGSDKYNFAEHRFRTEDEIKVLEEEKKKWREKNEKEWNEKYKDFVVELKPIFTYRQDSYYKETVSHRSQHKVLENKQTPINDAQEKIDNENFVKQLQKRNNPAIISKENFSSDSITSFEIVYCDGKDTTSVWIEKGDGIHYKSRVWIKHKTWFGIFNTSTHISFDYYMWVLFKKNNIMSWPSQDSVPPANDEESYGAIRLFIDEAEHTIFWKNHKPEQWDELLTFFIRFFCSNTRTSYELGCILGDAGMELFRECGYIKYFNQITPQPFQLQTPNAIFYPLDTNPTICPICGGETKYRYWNNHKKRFCRNCWRNVCDDIKPNIDITSSEGFHYGDAISSISVRVINRVYENSSFVEIDLFSPQKNECIVKILSQSKKETAKESEIKITREQWNELAKKLFREAFILDWQRLYSPERSNVCDYYNDTSGNLDVVFNKSIFKHENLHTMWIEKRPPYWKKLEKAFADLNISLELPN